MDRKKVLLLINPNSGKKNSKGQLLDVLNEFASHNYQMEVYVSQKQMDITFTLARVDYPQAEQLLQTLVKEKYAKTIMGDNKLAKLSVVGIGLHSHPGIIHTLFQTLDLAEINVILALSSALRISLMVSESQIVRGVQVLHRAFGLGKE